MSRTTPGGGQKRGPIRYAPTETAPTLESRGATEAKYLDCSFSDDGSLSLQFVTGEGVEFNVILGKEELVPIEWPDHQVTDLEQEIVDALMIYVAETIFKYKATAIRGQRLNRLK